MEYKDIQDSLTNLARLTEELEDHYIESDGEVTPEAEALEAQRDALAYLLQNDGVDMLGRWLKSKEDEVKTWKAEKAAADRRMKSAQNTVDFIKAKITEIMMATGMEKAKGSFYAFSKTVSETNTVDTDELDRIWLAVASSAAHEAGLPDYVDVVLKTTATALKEAEATEFISTNMKDTVRFTKPRRTE